MQRKQKALRSRTQRVVIAYLSKARLVLIRSRCLCHDNDCVQGFDAIVNITVRSRASGALTCNMRPGMQSRTDMCHIRKRNLILPRSQKKTDIKNTELVLWYKYLYTFYPLRQEMFPSRSSTQVVHAESGPWRRLRPAGEGRRTEIALHHGGGGWCATACGPQADARARAAAAPQRRIAHQEQARGGASCSYVWLPLSA